MVFYGSLSCLHAASQRFYKHTVLSVDSKCRNENLFFIYFAHLESLSENWPILITFFGKSKSKQMISELSELSQPWEGLSIIRQKLGWSNFC